MPTDVDCSSPADGPLPRDLRCTGLYGRPAQKQVACGLLEYAPAYALWSDGADKRRFASIPQGMQIDARDPDALVFPVGTKFWKEFSVHDAQGKPRLAETRLIQKSADGWLYTSYVWNEAQTEAIQMDNTAGVPNLDGTGHAVPTRDQCNECHGGRDDFVLGWDAVMLGAGVQAATPEKLVELGWLSGPLATPALPGSATEQAALGYLHANCGVSCHNENSGAKARDSGLYLRLEGGELGSVMATDTFRTSMNKKPAMNAKVVDVPDIAGGWLAIRPGQPERSLLVARQKIRKPSGSSELYSESQMPRIGTLHVDDAGVQTIVDWIAAMPTLPGYPPADP